MVWSWTVHVARRNHIFDAEEGKVKMYVKMLSSLSREYYKVKNSRLFLYR